MDRNAEVVDQLESHWRHQLRPRLSGLTDDEYVWQPVPDCWTISRRGTSSAPAGTADEALRRLDSEHDLWVEGVRGLGTAGLAEPPRTAGTIASLLKSVHKNEEVVSVNVSTWVLLLGATVGR